MPAQPVYKVIFQNGNQVFEVFARQIYQSDMWGFIEVEEFVFGERSQILVDPSEEKLKADERLVACLRVIVYFVKGTADFY